MCFSRLLLPSSIGPWRHPKAFPRAGGAHDPFGLSAWGHNCVAFAYCPACLLCRRHPSAPSGGHFSFASCGSSSDRNVQQLIQFALKSCDFLANCDGLFQLLKRKIRQ